MTIGEPALFFLTVRIDFQLTYARKAWQEERDSWRAVIQLNLLRCNSSQKFPLKFCAHQSLSLRSVNTILDILQRDMNGSGQLPSPASSDSEDEDETRDSTGLQFAEVHKLLKLRLAPLRRVQKDLERRLGSGAEEPTDAPPGTITEAAPQEFFVRSSTGWKGTLEKLRTRNSRDETHSREWREKEAEETNAIIAGCRDEYVILSSFPLVRTAFTTLFLACVHSGTILRFARCLLGGSFGWRTPRDSSWMTWIALQLSIILLQTTMLCGRVYGQWEFRNIGSFLTREAKPARNG